MKKGRRILFVAMHHSIHTARWIDMIADAEWSLHLFPLDQDAHNAKLRNITIHRPTVPPQDGIARLQNKQDSQVVGQSPLSRSFVGSVAIALQYLRRTWHTFKAWLIKRKVIPESTRETVTIVPFYPTFAELGGSEVAVGPFVRLGESENCAPTLHGPTVLASVIRRVQPDLIHSMEFQHAGYLVLRAKELYGDGFPPWLATNWGSDIFYFGRFDDHRAQIGRLLANIDFYSCECGRDIQLARDLGYFGPLLPVLPNSGGFDIEHLAQLRSAFPPSQRKVLMVKGYEHFAGRAMTSLKVLDAFADHLRDYEVIMFSVSAEPRRKALELAEIGALNIRVIDWASHDEILSCFGRARLYLGISISDAISTSVLEAMAMGAFPIQTNTSCCDEWFEDGVGGFLIPPDDLDIICDRFKRALEDDFLVDRAAEVNAQTVAARLDRRVLRPQVEGLYDTIFQVLQDGSGPAERTGVHSKVAQL